MATSENKVKLYSKLAIVLFSIFGTTFYGALMYSANLKAIGKKDNLIGPILFAIIFNLLVSSGLGKLDLSLTYTFLPINAVGGIILSFVFWKEQIGPDLEYKTRSIWPPLIALVVMYGVLIGLNVFTQS